MPTEVQVQMPASVLLGPTAGGYVPEPYAEAIVAVVCDGDAHLRHPRDRSRVGVQHILDRWTPVAGRFEVVLG